MSTHEYDYHSLCRSLLCYEIAMPKTCDSPSLGVVHAVYDFSKSSRPGGKGMGAFSIWHWIVVLGVVLIIFGPSRLPSLGHDLGKAIRGFKESIEEKNVTPEHGEVERKAP
jgi:sec-independent protein translocase protein TatA